MGVSHKVIDKKRKTHQISGKFSETMPFSHTVYLVETNVGLNHIMPLQ